MSQRTTSLWIAFCIWICLAPLTVNAHEGKTFLVSATNKLDLMPLEYSVQPALSMVELQQSSGAKLLKNADTWEFQASENAVIPEINKSVWYHAKLYNSQQNDIYRVLDFAEMLFYQLDVYLVNNDEVIYQARTGLEYIYDHRSLKSRLFAFELTLPANSITDLYIRIQTPHQPLIYPVLFSNSEYVASAVQHSAISLLIIGMLLGLLLLMSFATLLSHHGIKVISFGSVVVTMTINILYANGLIFQSIPNSPGLHMYLYPITISISALGTLWFARELFEIPTRMPIIDKAVILMLIAYTAIPILSFIHTPADYMLFLNYSSMVSALLLFSIGIMGIYKRMSSAYFFLIGMTLFAGLTAWTVLGSLGHLPYGPMGRHLYEGGILAMGVFFTLAIGQQLYYERLERIKLKQEADLATTRNQMKSDFIATMSHEIRTPINGVLGMAQLLKETPQNPIQQRYTHAITDSGNKLLRLINDILDLSKVEAGKLTLELAPIPISELIDHCGIIADSHQTQGKVNFTALIDENIPKTIIADESRLLQVINNLLGNAFKFTHEGSVTLHVTRCQEEDGFICIYVKDTGIGIPTNIQEQLFQPYVQADKTMSRKYGGSGLGLAICQRIMTTMQGSIHLESTVGQGSEFIVRFPLIEPEDSTQSASDLNAEDSFETDDSNLNTSTIPKKQLLPISVLAAEDNPINQMVIKGILDASVEHLSIVNNGQEAVTAFENNNDYDLLLIDCEMPEMDGFTATEIIRKLPNGKSLPIYALTAHAMDSNRERCLASGMNGMLSKPINTEELLKFLSQIATQVSPTETS